MAITNGDGYFVVNDGGQDYFTRAGNFYIDETGLLVNSDGYRVQGINPETNVRGDITIPKQITVDGNSVGLQSISISQTGEIIAQYENGTVNTISNIALARFSNAEGLNKAGETYFKVQQIPVILNLELAVAHTVLLFPANLKCPTLIFLRNLQR